LFIPLFEYGRNAHDLSIRVLSLGHDLGLSVICGVAFNVEDFPCYVASDSVQHFRDFNWLTLPLEGQGPSTALAYMRMTKFIVSG
jgi:hypothetical protein